MVACDPEPGTITSKPLRRDWKSLLELSGTTRMMTTNTKTAAASGIVATEGAPPSGSEPEVAPASNSTLAGRLAGSRYLGISAVVFAALQAICPAVVAFSAVRVAIGLGALAAAGTDLTGSAWHQDWIRIPMLAVAALGAVLNLFVIWHVRRLRQRPAAQWRVSPATPKKLRSERFQIALAVLTFVLIGAELSIHHS